MAGEEKQKPDLTQLTPKQAVDLVWGQPPTQGLNDIAFLGRLKARYEDPTVRGRVLFNVLRVLPQDNEGWGRKSTPGSDRYSLGVSSVISVAGTDEAMANEFISNLAEQYQSTPETSFFATAGSELLVGGLTQAWNNHRYDIGAFSCLVGAFGPHLGPGAMEQVVQNHWNSISEMRLSVINRAEKRVRFAEDVISLIENEVITQSTRDQIGEAIGPYQETIGDAYDTLSEIKKKEKVSRQVVFSRTEIKGATGVQLRTDQELSGVESTFPPYLRGIEVILMPSHLFYHDLDALFTDIRFSRDISEGEVRKWATAYDKNDASVFNLIEENRICVESHNRRTVAIERDGDEYRVNTDDPTILENTNKVGKMMYKEEPKISLVLDPSEETLERLSQSAKELAEGQSEVVLQQLSVQEMTDYYCRLLGLSPKEYIMTEGEAMTHATQEKKKVIHLQTEDGVITFMMNRDFSVSEDNLEVPIDAFYNTFPTPQWLCLLPVVSFVYHPSEDDLVGRSERSDSVLRALQVIKGKPQTNHPDWKRVKESFLAFSPPGEVTASALL